MSASVSMLALVDTRLIGLGQLHLSTHKRETVAQSESRDDSASKAAAPHSEEEAQEEKEVPGPTTQLPVT